MKIGDFFPGFSVSITMLSIILMIWGVYKEKKKFIYCGGSILQLEILTLLILIASKLSGVAWEKILLGLFLTITPIISFLLMFKCHKLKLKILGIILINFEFFILLATIGYILLK